MTVMPFIQGHGGGSKKGGSADDTLRSFAYAKVIDAVSEGEIEGLVDGENSIYINGTPIKNIKEATWQFRAGLPDDAPLVGFDSTEAFVSVGTEISEELGPVIRTISDANIDAVKIFMQLNVLYKTDDKGALKTVDSGWRVDIRPAGGAWTEVVTFDLKGEKVTSPTQFEHEIALTGSAPWDIRLRHRFGERDKVEQNITWTGYSSVTDSKFSYPHTALVALNLSSEHVGTSTPTRQYHIKGRKILVPTNYDPIARTYAGIWDGTFKRVWSNNPAWVLYDMVENDIFGIGADVDISVLNKWKLYTIAQYSDQLVPSGYKDGLGDPVMEPRYSFNGVLTNKKEALEALRSMTTVWRGMGFYALNQFFITADMPQDPAHIYGMANVIDGRFEYSTSSVKTRNSVVMVRFNDPNNMFESAIEPVVDDAMLKKFGWREKTLELTGCSSRSLAHRYGKWVIDTEKSETETVTFSVGLDSIHALPGEVIAINDPRRAEVRTFGRIKEIVATDTIRFDQPIDASVNKTGVTIYVHKPDGTIFTHVTDISVDGAQANIGTGNATADLVNCTYIISATNVSPRLYRIISIEEGEGETFKITGLQYDATKFARVEQGINFDPLPVRVDNTEVNPPTALTVESRSYTDGGQIRNDIEIGWTPAVSQISGEYRVYVDTPSASGILAGRTARNSLTYSTYEPGEYTFRVVAVSITGSTSEPATITHTVQGAEAIPVGAVMDLVNAATLIGGASVAFTGTDVRLSWRNMMKVSSVAAIEEVDTDNALYSHTTLEFYFGATKVRTQRVIGNSFIYTLDMNAADAAAAGFSGPRRNFSVQAYLVDVQGRSSSATSISLVNAAPIAIAPTVTVEGTKLNISWAPCTDEDMSGYLVHVRPTSGSVDGVTPTGVAVANSYRFIGDPETLYYVNVTAFDVFGTSGLNYATAVSATTDVDFSIESIRAEIEEIAAGAGIPSVTSLPAIGDRDDQIVLLKTTGVLYRWNATVSEWQTTLYTAVKDDSVTSNSIVANAVIASKIATGAVTATKISVAELSAVSAQIGILRTATSGARMEVHTDKILVYDASNVLRVRIGNLSG